jgi:transposase
MAMMGPATGQQDRLFYAFNVEDRIPSNHLLRRMDAVLDLSWLRAELLPFYSHTGCSSIDPELMILMLLVGYCYSIRSERRLCQEVELNLAYRWFCRLGLEDKVPDHSSFSVNRHGRFRDSDILRKVFESVVRRYMDAGLVKGEGFAIDASVIEADASRFRRIEGSQIEWSEAQLARRAIREYVEALEGETAPINPKRKPKALSPTDPNAAWTTRGRNKVMFGYSLNYLIDMEEAVIVDVEATPTRISKEVEATQIMIERTQKRFGLRPDHIAGDVAYGTGKLLGWLVDRNIDPHVPVWDKSRTKDDTFSRADFIYDPKRDLYICPAGKTLKTTGTLHADNVYRYLASRHDCDACPLKPRCCPNMPARRLPRDINEAARDHTRSLSTSEAYSQSARDRKKIERLFGEAKRNLAMTRLRLRGLSGAKDEFHLLAIVQNLKRLVKYAIRPPPRPIMA